MTKKTSPEFVVNYAKAYLAYENSFRKLMGFRLLTIEEVTAASTSDTHHHIPDKQTKR